MTASPAGMVYLANVDALLLEFFHGEDYGPTPSATGLTLPDWIDPARSFAARPRRAGY